MNEQELATLASDLAKAPHIATVGTIEPDGSPQLSPVWITHDDNTVTFSTVEGRRKHTNIDRDPRISISITDSENPMRRIELRGRAVIVDDPDGDLIQRLSLAYTGSTWTEKDPEARRVIIRLTPQRLVGRS
ncbi:MULTISPECIES: PPOX class F420-dependent oxidoreductase [Rhodococcus]|uniref:PPOX class F420-dependent oxidoreductase n=1 Tax=Rhodococcus TaxID=1827 RepID=UPI001E64E4A2|nr:MULTISPECIES: PPOX class F420-dependent oxidoreductase [Rhodococcus]MCD2108559.1 PPOX class F420-dependent oxidoreductase [Rhodococcus qingshengii]MCZ4527452.1 PPOX class F420-dependent oxidoreductase [Rhodococcus erythropolis]MDV8008267.1 PPOX class F420-dependent oxidoreductase [Rhodococcus sp. IEGM 1318]